jgi:hypothetical protein
VGDRGSKKAKDKIQQQQVKKQKDKQTEKDARVTAKAAAPQRA